VGDDISNENLDASYFSRIKGLALRQKLRTFFVESNVHETNKKRRASLMTILPYIQARPHSTSASSEEIESEYKLSLPESRTQLAADMETALADPSTHAKLKKLKGVIINAMSPFSPEKVKERQHRNSIGNLNESMHSDGSGAEGESLLDVSCNKESSLCGDEVEEPTESIEAVIKEGSHIHTTDAAVINFNSFCRLLRDAELNELAIPEIFSLFDKDGSGNIDIKEFLLTLLACRPIENRQRSTSNPNLMNSKTSQQMEEDQLIESAKLYFNMFDINETGYIDLEELKLVVGCLVRDELSGLDDEDLENHPASAKNIEELFNTMDLAKNGIIDFNEFLMFYKTVLLSSTKLKLNPVNPLVMNKARRYSGVIREKRGLNKQGSGEKPSHSEPKRSSSG
jgi:Ca2+-binding EF-hand superfamily protein